MKPPAPDYVQCLIFLKSGEGSTPGGFTLVSPQLRQIAPDSVLGLLNSSAPYATLEEVNPPKNSKFSMIEMWQDLNNFTGQNASQERRIIVDKCNYEKVLRLFPEESDVGFCIMFLNNDPKYTALVKNNLKILRKLLESGADIKWRRPEGGTTLAHFAAEKGSVLLMELLGQCGADLSGGGSKDSTPLCIAAKRKDVESVKVLLANGADINGKAADGSSVLHIATKAGLLEVVQLLVEKGASVDVRTTKGWTALHLAADTGNFEVAALLFEHGADLESRIGTGPDEGATALHLAIKKDRWAVAKWLVLNGASLNTECNKGRNALYFAVTKNNASFVEFLLSRGLDFTSSANRKAFYLASEKKYSLIVKKMMEFGLVVDAAVVAKANVLFEAIQNNLFELVEKLLESGADVHQKYSICNNKLKPIHAACRYTDVKMVQLLLDYGADVEELRGVGRRNTPIADAVEYGREEIVKFLLAKNASVRDRPDFLFSATQYKRHKLMMILLENHADVNSRGDHYSVENKTCLYVAAFNEDLKAIEILLKFGATLDFKDIFYVSKYSSNYAVCTTLEVLEVLLAHSFTITLDAADAVYLHEVLTEFGVEDFSSAYQNTQKCARATAQYLLKMEAAGRTVAGGAHSVIPACFLEAYDFEDVQWECEQELDEMKARTICRTGITHFDLLTKPTNRFARFLWNEDIRNELQEYEFRTEYPQYGNILKYQFQRANWRRELLVGGMKTLSLLNWQFRALPFELKESILGFLNNQDLLVLEKCLPVEE